MCVHIATDSTRALYQRKLLRWLKFGSTAGASVLDSSQVEPHVCHAAQPNMSTFDDDSCAQNSRGNDIAVGARNGPTSSYTPSMNGLKVAAASATAVNSHEEQHRSAAARPSKSEELQSKQSSCVAEAESSPDSSTATGTGWFDNVQRKQKAKYLTAEPDVTEG